MIFSVQVFFILIHEQNDYFNLLLNNFMSFLYCSLSEKGYIRKKSEK